MAYTYKVVNNSSTNVSTCHNKNYKYHANDFYYDFFTRKNINTGNKTLLFINGTMWSWHIYTIMSLGELYSDIYKTQKVSDLSS